MATDYQIYLEVNAFKSVINCFMLFVKNCEMKWLDWFEFLISLLSSFTCSPQVIYQYIEYTTDYYAASCHAQTTLRHSYILILR